MGRQGFPCFRNKEPECDVTNTSKERSRRGEGGGTEIKTVAAYRSLGTGHKPTKPQHKMKVVLQMVSEFSVWISVLFFVFLISFNPDTSEAPVHNKLAPKLLGIARKKQK